MQPVPVVGERMVVHAVEAARYANDAITAV